MESPEPTALAWTMPAPVSAGQVGLAVSAVVTQGQLQCVYQNASPTLGVAAAGTSDGSSWGTPTAYAHPSSSLEAPGNISAALFRGDIYCAAVSGYGPQPGPPIVAPLSSSATVTTLPDPSDDPTGSPTLVTFGEELFCFYRGGSGRVWWTSTTDGQAWGPPVAVPGCRSASDPAAVSFNGRLYVAGSSMATQAQLWTTSSPNGRSWRASSTACSVGGAPVPAAGPPGLAVFNGDLYCAVAANAGSGSLVFLSTGDGLAWSTPTTVPEADVLPPARPSLLAFGIALYWFLPGTQDGGPLAMCSVLD